MISNTEEQDALRQEIDSLYTPLEEAREEIWRRWNNTSLRKKVEDFIKGDIPEILKDSPKAVLGRQLLSPNFEALHFSQLARTISLQAICFGYLNDKLVTKNLDKYFLCKLYFDDGIGKKNGRKLSSLSIVDFNQSNGKSLVDVKTIFGINFCDFHLRLADSMKVDIQFFDASEFLEKSGGKGREYYEHYLALFICYGVLFENYPLSGAYAEYTRDVFLPSYKKISKFFGLKPLIVQMVPAEVEDDTYWRHYPKIVYDKIDYMMIQNKN
jgi:hypothetical protein